MPPVDRSAASKDVEALLESLKHPRLPEIHALRSVILGVDRRISESIKWNAPSFAITEHFATFHLRARTGVQVVLHLGAKSRPATTLRSELADPTGMLDWRGPDRATVTFSDRADIASRKDAFVAVLRQWIEYLPR